MDFETIGIETADGVMTITLNRPDAMNAFNIGMREELIAAFDRADADDSVRAIIMTGAGRAFCAGADLSRGPETFDPRARAALDGAGFERDGGGIVSLRIFDLKKPIIAAVNGAAVGVGVTMTLPMDVRIASTKARFGFVFARRGVVMEACSSWFLPRIAGPSQAMEWVASGRVFGAEEALAGGLVRSLHAPEDLLPAAQAIAREIAENTSAVSVALCRQLIWKGLTADHPMTSHIAESRCLQGYMGRMPDSREGVASFLEKRKAQFPMKVSTDLPPFYPWWPQRSFE